MNDQSQTAYEDEYLAMLAEDETRRRAIAKRSHSGAVSGNREVTPRAAEIKRKMVSLNAITAVLEVNYLVKGWLTVNGLSVIYGPSNAGKTFVALSLAMHLAAGEPWMGCKVNQGPVFYIAAEGGAGVLNKLMDLNEVREFGGYVWRVRDDA